MEPSLLPSILTLGFGLGLLHALDADHIMAVSVLASADGQDANAWSVKRMLRFCCGWALGHGGVLCALAMLLVFAGVELPAMIAEFAEKLIGIFLIALGGWIFWNMRQHKLSLKVHSHNEITHVHLSHTDKIHHTHQSVLVGVTHGLAGSAPILALIPVMQTTSAWVGLGYVALFSLGVLCTMAVFGLFFGYVQKWIACCGKKLFQFSRMGMASASIAFGCYWFFA